MRASKRATSRRPSIDSRTVVAEAGGEVSGVDRWGNRRFAYEIDHQNEGYYFVATFQAPEDAIEALKRIIQISDEFIRGKIVGPSRTPQSKSRS